MVKVYLPAHKTCMAACHVGFMSYTSRLSPVFKHQVPTWDLETVLDVLFHPPFELLGQVDLKVLSLNTVLLLASAKQVSDIYAFLGTLTVFSFLQIMLCPNPASIPNNTALLCPPQDLAAFSSSEQGQLHT